ncbi:hypothetical protein SERLA73DRAFT_177420 [Serpula lacrymans var. lacrymans S7.3]|uniref:Uncharacterized protein n=2 Tax=Serpula lacrymans var. lacrymans TaxID=341189 RepID=F8PNZ1_SERL3|nr:uncharacterized protein SERLADRAFT_461006 [Serpula lacrymans var. lacrymans S7.9]EGO01868.1 hypothetical protein SERLA73DRAFT_177420 [Serpula lacrymans var. lacrymans S7.3]EGO27495.1 hypothetical protein SERLADRAFT_461006 [Serpula lacrymans var. lacrymans S7.9]
MLSTLDVDIRPGAGIGMFEIGSSLWSVIDMLRGLQHIFPQVDVKYDPDSSATTPVILHLRPHFDLLFSGYHQRLHTICLKKLRDPYPPVSLRYKDTLLSSAEDTLVKVLVSRTFGPTYPGDDLRYPGLWFSFEEDAIGEGFKGASPHPDDRKQEVRRIFVSQKSHDGEERDALDEVTECSIMDGDVVRAVVKVHDGLLLYRHPSTTDPLHVRIGETTAQDLNIDLGPPPRVHYKEDDRMTIHSPNQSRNADRSSHYFYNYFQHGIDFLISGETHIVLKIILHTNVPGSPLFQRYKRCPWELEGKPEDDEDDSPPRMHFYDKFETISHFLCPRDPPPSMLLDRTDEEDDITLPSSTTRLYGYDGVILEVTEASQVVAVILF